MKDQGLQRSPYAPRYYTSLPCRVLNFSPSRDEHLSSQTKRSKKKAQNPASLTPEFIAEQRRLKKEAQEAKRQELIAQGIDPDQVNIPAELRFIKRPMLSVPGCVKEQRAVLEGVPEKLPITIMTYNLLAQALIRRKLFPTSGDALKWSRRSRVLLAEFKQYKSDILLLQEVDFVQYKSFWKDEFEKMGYALAYHRAGAKNHGVAIVWQKHLFEMKNQCFIDYDRTDTGDVLPRTITRNVGLIAALEFTPQLKKKYPNTTRSGILIGTTHLFWHPFGTYERARQTYIILAKFKEFAHTMSVVHNKGAPGKWFQFFGGDFNSQPFDAPYLSITRKPVVYDERCRRVVECSTSYIYSKNRGAVENENSNGDEDEENEEEPGGNVEKFGDQPKDPVPESFTPTPEQSLLVQQITDLHNALDMRVISLYSIGYKSTHPENSGTDNDRNEPAFSNWAHAWRGLLDYIFVVTAWDVTSDCRQVDSVEDVSRTTGVELRKLLRMPEPAEMGEEPSGQPRAGMYGSDHLCMIAEVDLDMGG
ncbi:hypothetical protein BABINDRAFT_172525 [Babjeviella inositovora NRRL Y-12698]|uniref:Endonuclease/exonuclease/phosphatase domain-containing protein n=1 Tax=Babjeviella inositovora NRRL Y-12698 TaxID=984486 RepID=A0A1E3QK65_9ASCO|nr:uncharacterized protein BABINDRAFT_172525 [Babjeviella inositovora NRRL Y-12698]ODQ78089.1 hypothetical protein BABINDRAFT_172525 [Babjeviella inositovora NRRL Y-12698]